MSTNSSVNNWLSFYEISLESYWGLIENRRNYNKTLMVSPDHRTRRKMWIQSMTAIVFSITAIEAYLNYRAELILDSSPLQWNELERVSTEEKFYLVYSLSMGDNRRLKEIGLSHFKRSLRLRNSIIHQKYSNKTAISRRPRDWVEWAATSVRAAHWILSIIPRDIGRFHFIEPIPHWKYENKFIEPVSPSPI